MAALFDVLLVFVSVQAMTDCDGALCIILVVYVAPYRYITMHKCVFSALRHFFSSGRGSFLVLSDPWHAGSPPGPLAQVWALAEVRGTCSGGSKWQVPTGRDSEHE